MQGRAKLRTHFAFSGFDGQRNCSSHVATYLTPTRAGVVTRSNPRMNRARKIAVTVSLGLLVLCLAGSFMTRGVMEHLPFLHGQKESWAETIVPRGIVDQRPWQTAATLA